MLLGVPGLKRALFVLALLSVVFVTSCYNSSSGPSSTTSGLTFRAFVAQSVTSSISTGSVIIVDAKKDALAPVFGIGSGTGGVGRSPILLFVSPNKTLTLSYSSGDNLLALINNSLEQLSGSVTLSAPTESIVISTDNASAFVALPTAPVVGEPPGEIQVISLGTGVATTRVPVPAVRYLAQSHDGNRILAFSDNATDMSVIVPSNIGNTNPVLTVPGFDRPVAALFSPDDTRAYVLNCGAECGGTAASVQVVNMVGSQPTLLNNIPVPAATVAFLDGSTLYVAGTPPGTPCTVGAAAQCGTLSVIDLNSSAVTSTSEITDGYHNRIDMGADGQLFVGARTCTNIFTATDQRGCLSIFNTATSAVVVPIDNGDVTGIQAITNRHVVYVTQGGELRIYDTRTDALQEVQVDIFGAASDVKLVDF